MDTPRAYGRNIRSLLTPQERRLFERLNTPHKIQDYLDRMPVSFKDTYRSPRDMLRLREAQCLEGAVFAAAVLAYHGKPPLLLDLRTREGDSDHVVAIFRERGHWGAISKTNHPVLRFRDPVYRTVRELAVSFFHEYFLNNGAKTLRDFSRPFDMRRYAPERWVTSAEPMPWLVEALDGVAHEKILPSGMREGHLRKASKLERDASAAVEWRKSKISQVKSKR